MAVGLALLYLAALAIGTLLLRKSLDELEQFRTYQAISVAGTAFMVVYPVWFLLWKAGFLVEPIHWLLFAGFWFVATVAAIYHHFR